MARRKKTPRRTTFTASEAMERLRRRDPTLKHINLRVARHTDLELAELTDCLLAHPDVVTTTDLSNNRLTDETGLKLARYLAISSTIQFLSLYNTQLGSGTYLALAAALRVNSSLLGLYLYANPSVDQTSIDAAFVEALRLNPDRPTESEWWLHSARDGFKRLKQAADALGPPSMLSQLRHCDCTWSKK